MFDNYRQWLLSEGQRLKGYTTGGGGVLPYVSYVGMCRCEGYDFQAISSGDGV